MSSGCPADRKEPDKRFRVLVIEDDPEMREALREILELSGFTVTTAKDGTEGAAALADRYDVVLSDVRVPGQSGLALARSLRHRSDAPQVILITAYPEWKVYEEAAEAGAAAVEAKAVRL